MNLRDNTLEKNILKTIVYFDLFNYPLTAQQIFLFLPQNSVAYDEVKRTAEALVAKHELRKVQEYFLLSTQSDGIIERRLNGERRAKRMMFIARMFSLLIKQFPFVRAIFLTGSLSKNVADSSSDIDFMIVTSPDRLWICRTLLTAFRRVFLFGSRKYFCTNYYVTENSYRHPRRNIYTALEVATTKVVWNETAFKEYQSRNDWIREFLPNIVAQPERGLLISSSRSLFQRFLEQLLNFFPLHQFNRALMESYRRHWKRKFSHVDGERFNTMFMISPDVSACWWNEHQESVLTRFQQTLSSLGIEKHL
jgi:hypothetical protein